MDEISGIASEPKDVHVHYVSAYNALVAITNTVINDTCKAGMLMLSSCAVVVAFVVGVVFHHLLMILQC